MWSECSETTHWGSERSHCMLTYDAFICSKRARGDHWSVLPGGVKVSFPAGSGRSASNILTGVPDGGPTTELSHPTAARPSERNKQWRRSCQHPNCLEVLHLLALDGPVHCKHTWSAELYLVNCVESGVHSATTDARMWKSKPCSSFPLSCPAVPGLPRELGGNCLSAPWRQVDGHFLTWK